MVSRLIPTSEVAIVDSLVVPYLQYQSPLDRYYSHAVLKVVPWTRPKTLSPLRLQIQAS